MKRRNILFLLLAVCFLGIIVVWVIKSNFEYAENSILHIVELDKKESGNIKVYILATRKVESNTYITVAGDDVRQLALTQEERKEILEAFDGQELSTYKEKNFEYDMAITVNAIAQIFIDTDAKMGYAIKDLEHGYYTGYFKLSNGQESALAHIIEVEQ